MFRKPLHGENQGDAWSLFFPWFLSVQLIQFDSHWRLEEDASQPSFPPKRLMNSEFVSRREKGLEELPRRNSKRKLVKYFSSSVVTLSQWLFRIFYIPSVRWWILFDDFMYQKTMVKSSKFPSCICCPCLRQFPQNPRGRPFVAPMDHLSRIREMFSFTGHGFLVSQVEELHPPALVLETPDPNLQGDRRYAVWKPSETVDSPPQKIEFQCTQQYFG